MSLARLAQPSRAKKSALAIGAALSYSCLLPSGPKKGMICHGGQMNRSISSDALHISIGSVESFTLTMERADQISLTTTTVSGGHARKISSLSLQLPAS